jgi:hemerythrin superfamily protein
VTLPDNADVIDLLLHQHHEVKRSLAEVETLEGDSKMAAFSRLEKLLSSHENAEQEVVHPVTRDQAGNPGLAHDLVQDEDEATAVMSELHALGAGNPEFDPKFSSLRDAVLGHNAREESEEFPLLRRTQSAQRLEELADDLRAVQSMR